MTRKAIVVGAGRIAGLNELDPVRRKPCTHLGALRAAPGIEIAGVVDADPGRAADFANRLGIPRHGSDLASMLRDIRPEIVTVAVPYKHQHEVVRIVADAAKRPEKLLLEKPLADSLEGANSIIEICAAAKIPVLVNNEAAAPVYGQVAELLAGHFENGIIAAHAWCSSGMHAVGIHVLGVLRLLLGEVAWVRAVAETEYVASLPFSNNFTPSDPRIHGMMVFASGVTVFLTNSALMQFTCKDIEFTCRTGRLRLSGNGTRLELWGRADPGESSLSWTLAEPSSVPVDKRTAFDAIAGFLADPDPMAGQDLIGGRLALDTYKLLDALIRSARDGRDVVLSR